MDFIIYPLASLGFIFGLSAYTQVNSLKSKIKELENEIENIKS